MLTPTAAISSLLLSSVALAGPGFADWRDLEAPLLRGHVQLTDESMFVKAGEAYYSPDANWIVFQAVPVPPAGEAPSPHYSMYVARLLRNDVDGRVLGLAGDPILISPPGSANTCGWFHPQFPWKVMFGSTIEPPAIDDQPGFRVGTRRYVWSFPREMEVVQRSVPEMHAAMHPATNALPDFGQDALRPVKLFERDGYDAEGSWSADGRFLLYTHAAPPVGAAEIDGDLWVWDTETDTHTPLVTNTGYDGGPFFSPDDTWICYRSDRSMNDRLQLYVSELEYDAAGAITGIAREVKLTSDEHVNWAPFWFPGGERGDGALVYTSSRMGHDNYDVFALRTGAIVRGSREAGGVTPRRLTMADGFDGLAVFNPNGREMMWTSQRKPSGERGSGSSQLWIAQLTNGTTAASLSGRLDAAQAALIALQEVGAGWSADARRFGSSWEVTLTRPQEDARVVIVAPDGAVRAFERGVD